ncbi:MAG: PhzF family phenazine biosynthesis protein, partial [Flavisolibacter sp.]|nr:PhzF family phenazine biosynthesis protein [Flavisolibacter sp.]
MEIRYYHVDAFTHQPFKGNAAGVCLLPDALPDETLQNIAAENNLANTAFVWREKEQYKLRWFTPKVEVALCGHATLAASHVLWSEGLADAHETLRFQTLSGILEVQKLPNGFLEMNFPAYANKPIDLPSTLREALPAMIINTVFAVDRYVVELSSEAEVGNLE